MHIAFVGPFGMAPKSTMSARALPLGRELVRRGHKVTMLLPPWDNPSDAGKRWESGGVDIMNVALPRSVPLIWYGALAWRLWQETARLRPDVVHLFKPKAFSGLVGQAYLWRDKTARPRVVVDTDDWEGAGGWNDRGGYPWWQRAFFAYQERWLLRHADAVTAASRTLAEMTAALRGGTDSTVYVPNGCPGAEPARGTADVAAARRRLGLGEGPVLLFYTRFVESPPERVVGLLASAVKRGVRATVLLAGTGLEGEDARFVAGAEALGLRVCHPGWVPREDLPAVFALADAAIFPMEDTLLNRAKCPAKLVDLLSAGVPVVAEGVGQCGEYIRDGESGLLVRPGDIEGFGAALARLLRDAPLRARLAAGARSSMERYFRWDRLVEGLLQAYTGHTSVPPESGRPSAG